MIVIQRCAKLEPWKPVTSALDIFIHISVIYIGISLPVHWDHGNLNLIKCSFCHNIRDVGKQYVLSYPHHPTHILYSPLQYCCVDVDYIVINSVSYGKICCRSLYRSSIS